MIGDQKITVLVKSVNNKGLSVNFRLPREALHLEQALYRIACGLFSRGRIDVSVNLENQGGTSLPEPDMDLARSYLEGADKLAKEFYLTSCPDAFRLVTLPGMMRVPDIAAREGFEDILVSTCREALTDLLKSRETEGQGLKKVFTESLEKIAALSEPVARNHGGRVSAMMDERRRRIADLTGDVELDENRMLQELALLSDRLDISEEYQRLSAHVRAALDSLENSCSGRKLGFILQEMLRELNTMGSKVDESGAVHTVIEMKDILGGLREQAANVQ